MARSIGWSRDGEVGGVGRRRESGRIGGEPGGAERTGLVARAVPADRLEEEALSVAAKIAGCSLPVVLKIEVSIKRACESSLAGPSRTKGYHQHPWREDLNMSDAPGTGHDGAGAMPAAKSAAQGSGGEDLGAIYCDPASVYAFAAFKAGKRRLVGKPRKADLLWMRTDYQEWFERLRPFQLLNHFPNERAVTDKGRLAENLQRLDAVRSKHDFGLRDFIQDTYCLYLPEERERFFGQLPATDSEDNLWILKPCTSSRGRGIKILWQFGDLRSLYANPAKHNFDPQAARYVIQRYIRNPLLLDGRKSEIRIYWLVASLDPLLVLMYREGTVRLNSKPFSLDDFGNTLIHVTNVFQQKAHPDYDPSVVLKWSFSDWESYLIRDLALAPENFIEGHLKPQLRRMLSFVVDAAAPSLAQGLANGLCFGFFGADIILDDALHPWLTEIQKGPGLSFEDPIKQKVIPVMLNEAAAIMLEVRRRKRDGLGFEKLDAVRDFEWVVHGA